LVIIFVIALFLRWLYLPQNSISFAYDQARDAFVVRDILQGDLKILGPSVSGVPGLYHGVLYYYVIALPYLFGHGNPVFVAYFLSFVSSLVIFLVFYLSFLLTKKYTPSILSSLLFAFSFEATQYANLLTNASMGVWFVPLIYIAILIESPLLLGLSFGLSVQSEVALLYHLIPIIILGYRKFSIKKIGLAVFVFLLAVSPMIMSELKFGFEGVKGMFYLASGADGITKAKVFSDYISTVLNQSGLTFAYSIFPINIVMGSLLGFLITIYVLSKKTYWSKFLFIYIFAYTFALPFGGWNMKHILVGIAPAVSVLVGIYIWKYLNDLKWLAAIFLVIILGTNLIKITMENKNGQTIFPLQEDLVLSKELELVDYTYTKSDSNSFSISTLTSPLFTNTLWEYLYDWYGNGKYGYTPTFLGHDQVGEVGGVLKKSNKSESLHFYIEEPTYGIPENYVQYQRGDEESYSNMVESASFGQLRVEKRNYKNER
jgi:hypothetical protein